LSLRLIYRYQSIADTRVALKNQPSENRLELTRAYLFFNLPRGATKVTGALGLSPGTITLGGDVSFFGFFAILLLRCSPLAMSFS